MTFLAPLTAIIAAALALPALLALYLLKRRRTVTPISSTLLWRRTLKDLQANAPFQKLRRNLLLLMQLLILAGLLIAMARPTRDAPGQAGQRTIVMIDRSGSMNATDVDAGGVRTRLDEALRQAERLINQQASSGGTMLVSFAAEAEVLQPFTTDHARLESALRAITPTDQPTSLARALELVEPFTRSGEGPNAASAGPVRLVVISDGRIPDADSVELSNVSVRFVPIGDQAGPVDNVGVVNFAARRSPQTPERVELFARLANFGPEPVELNLTLKPEGLPGESRSLTVPAARDAMGPGQAAVDFELVLADDTLVELRHDHVDALAADNVARLHIRAARQLRVALVTEGNVFLREAIRASGVRRFIEMTPDQWVDRGGPGEAVDVVVFDAWSPAELPSANALYFAAAPPLEGVTVIDDPDGPGGQQILDWRRSHPALRHVALEAVTIGRSVRLELPVGAAARILATGTDGPVLASVLHEQRRHLICAFDTLDTNWWRQISFPVFIANALYWLGLQDDGEAGLAFAPGQTASVPTQPGVEQARFRGPVDLEARARFRQAVLPRFDRVGLYVASSRDVEPPFDRLPVNFANLEESDLRPVDALEMRVGGQSTQAGGETVRQEIWPWFVLAAAAILMLEWLVYVKRWHI